MARLSPGADEVPCGADEEAGLHGRTPELHLPTQPGAPAGQPTVSPTGPMSPLRGGTKI